MGWRGVWGLRWRIILLSRRIALGVVVYPLRDSDTSLLCLASTVSAVLRRWFRDGNDDTMWNEYLKESVIFPMESRPLKVHPYGQFARAPPSLLLF